MFGLRSVWRPLLLLSECEDLTRTELNPMHRQRCLTCVIREVERQS
jgi:hypothetical protein